MEGGLHANECPGLRHLPRGLSAASVAVEACAAFEGFDPEFEGAFRVPGNAHFLACHALARFPEEVAVGGHFDLTRCARAWAGPSGTPRRLTAGGRAVLTGCAGLSELPEEMAVGQALLLIKCPSLRSVPHGEGAGAPRAGAYAGIFRCDGLERVDGISFEPGGVLEVVGCRRLRSIGDGARPERLSVEGCPLLERLPQRPASRPASRKGPPLP